MSIQSPAVACGVDQIAHRLGGMGWATSQPQDVVSIAIAAGRPVAVGAGVEKVLRTACGAWMDDGGDVRPAGKRYHQRSRCFEATTAQLELMATRAYALLRLGKQVGRSGMSHWSLD